MKISLVSNPNCVQQEQEHEKCKTKIQQDFITRKIQKHVPKIRVEYIKNNG